MTQPVFDVSLVEETKRRTVHLNIPIFIGIWPLMSARQAEFLHHEVPGIIVPDEIRKRLQDAPLENAARIGMEIAREIVSSAGAEFAGIYLITPFLHFDSTCDLARFARNM